VGKAKTVSLQTEGHAVPSIKGTVNVVSPYFLKVVTVYEDIPLATTNYIHTIIKSEAFAVL